MKFPELFSHFDKNALEQGHAVVACFGDDGEEYKFDYTKVPAEEKRPGESVVDTLTRLAKAIKAVANVDIDWYNTLWPEMIHGPEFEILVLWAGWKKNAELRPGAWRPTKRFKKFVEIIKNQEAHHSSNQCFQNE